MTTVSRPCQRLHLRLLRSSRRWFRSSGRTHRQRLFGCRGWKCWGRTPLRLWSASCLHCATVSEIHSWLHFRSNVQHWLGFSTTAHPSLMLAARKKGLSGFHLVDRCSDHALAHGKELAQVRPSSSSSKWLSSGDSRSSGSISSR